MNIPSPRDLDDATFGPTLEGAGIVVLDWWAPWCGPCRAFAPVFERAAAAHPDVTFARVNTEAQPALAAEFEVMSIPTVMVVRDGVILYNRPGMLPAKALDELVAAARAVDMPAVKRRLAQEFVGG